MLVVWSVCDWIKQTSAESSFSSACPAISQDCNCEHFPLSSTLRCDVKAHATLSFAQGLLWDTSLLDPEEGIRFRGYSIPELQVCKPGLAGRNMIEALLCRPDALLDF